jgi:ferric-dicitrate binding protein FerR (iron transport regulator)
MKVLRLSGVLVFFFFGVAAAMRAQSANESAALGLVATATNAQIGNAAASAGSSIYSGDYLSTSDNGSLLIRVGSLSLELQSSTGVHIYRAPYGAVVELNRGTVLYTTPGGSQNFVIVASDVRVTPLVSVPDFGRVSLDDPCQVTVSSQRGQAHVRVGSENRTVEEGKAYRVRAENEISYHKYLSPDDNDYHRYHDHRPCAPVDMVKGKLPPPPGQSHFLLLASMAIGAGTGVAVWKSMESPDHP